ncbi:MAG: hypothetical protein LBP35_05545 [Candidatus Ancillula trichonymphae]|nr:hypothetical protein [Candidatus Ancillula trichonymphae]
MLGISLLLFLIGLLTSLNARRLRRPAQAQERGGTQKISKTDGEDGARALENPAPEKPDAPSTPKTARASAAPGTLASLAEDVQAKCACGCS